MKTCTNCQEDEHDVCHCDDPKPERHGLVALAHAFAGVLCMFGLGVMAARIWRWCLERMT